MKLLIVAATEMEIKPLLNHTSGAGFEYLITGVGMTATTYALTRRLQAAKYDFVLQAGVGGCYGPNYSLGEIVLVSTDQFGDLGAEDHEDYIDIFEMGLLQENTPPYTSGKLETPTSPELQEIDLPRVSGLTINTVSGNERTIRNRIAKYGCVIESMEGAAFHYVCLQEKVAFAQVRAISNYVTPRDRSQWKMKEAIINLNDWLIGFIKRGVMLQFQS
jgi:futalosine hydrolase